MPVSSMRNQCGSFSPSGRRDDSVQTLPKLSRNHRDDVGIERNLLGGDQVRQARRMKLNMSSIGCGLGHRYAISNPALMSMSGSGVLKCGLPRVVGRSFAGTGATSMPAKTRAQAVSAPQQGATLYFGEGRAQAQGGSRRRCAVHAAV